MLKRFFLITALIAPSTFARGESFGIGAVIGNPTGLSMKLWLDQNSAIDGALAWSTDDSKSFHLQSDYLIHDHSLVRVGRTPLNFYYGAGGRLTNSTSKKKSSNAFGARAPIGLAHQFKNASVEIFAELAVDLQLAPSTEVSLSPGIGGRFYF